MNEQDPQRAQTEAETRDAARFALGLMALAALFFGVLSLGYGLRAPFVELGREGTVSWMFWKLDTLDTAALRAHPGGRVMWLVGSSVIRESFDEALAVALDGDGLASRLGAGVDGRVETARQAGEGQRREVVEDPEGATVRRNHQVLILDHEVVDRRCLLYTSPSPRD